MYVSLESDAKASVAIPLTALYPLLTVLLAVMFLSERLHLLQLVGISLALVAGYLMLLGSSSQDPSTAEPEPNAARGLSSCGLKR